LHKRHYEIAKSWRETGWDVFALPDEAALSVYSLGYISPPTNWIGTAMPLLDEAANALRLLLNQAELREGPIAFTCHSLGGQIVKQILRSANEQRGDPEVADLLARARQVIFIATPHTGSGKATLIEKLGFWTWGSDSARDLVANKPELRDLNFGYRIFVKERKDQIRHLSYYEMVDTIFGRIVEPNSADPGLPNCIPTPIREDHISIAKPRRRRLSTLSSFNCRYVRSANGVREAGGSGGQQANAGRGDNEAEFVKLRTDRDRNLPMPNLMLSALQVNISGGRLPAPEDDCRRYLKIPLNAFPQASWNGLVGTCP
jgi:hypothetical protein